jgi:hypothetical protein
MMSAAMPSGGVNARTADRSDEFTFEDWVASGARRHPPPPAP